MYRWYRNSGYAYLSDVLAPVDSDRLSTPELRNQFEKSRWFRRGWTLQELLAPSNLRFYSAEWRVPIGTKKDLIQDIARITKIDLYALNGGNLQLLSVARRMSWIANRQKIREEDMA